MASRLMVLFHNKRILNAAVSSLRRCMDAKIYHRARNPTILISGAFLSTSAGDDDELRKRLSPEQYHVCREKGTEMPWSGEYVRHKEKGVYQCVCCGVDLFSSTTKFESGTGWPSFYAAIGEKTKDDATQSAINNIAQKRDISHGMLRVEVLCKQCDSHLGHMFDDGPEPTGLRYCINSASLSFSADK